jgi:hypothetical protein
MDNQEEYDEIVDKYIDSFAEGKSYKAKRTTITKVTRQTKIDRAIGALATKYAKEVNDPMYRKLVKFRDRFYKYRERIRAKYGPRVRSRAIQGKGISDMLKDKQKSGSQTGKKGSGPGQSKKK